MTMFLGETNPSLTEGSRVALPKKFRDQIAGDTVIASRGFESCIFIYPTDGWVKEAEKLDGSITDPEARALRRYMHGGASEVNLDSQGRMVIPGHLKAYAKLDKNLAVIGAGDHIEVWDLAIWEEYLERISKKLSA